jgi:UDP-N-acetyl-D-glucosamine dehydrogenase
LTRPRCAVVGLGLVGSSTLRYLAGSGFPVVGYDLSPEAAARAEANLAAQLDPGARWGVGADPAVLADAEVVLVAVRLTRDGQGAFQDAALEGVAGTLRAHGRDGQLVIIESTLAPGTTRRFAAWLDRPGVDVAHAPERLRVGDADAILRAVPRLVGGLTPRATKRAGAFLEAAGLRPDPVSTPEVSELAKLLENAFLTTNIALVGEITRLANGLGLAAREVTAAAATKPHGYFPFHPGPGIGGHCLRNDLDLLRQHGAELALRTPLLDSIASVAEELPRLVVERLEGRLAADGRLLSRAAVLLVGVGFKPGSPDVTESPAVPITQLLRRAGAAPAYLDEQVSSFTVDGMPLPRLRPGELSATKLAAVLVLAGDRTVAVETLRDSGACLLDTGGGAIMQGRFALDEQL